MKKMKNGNFSKKFQEELMKSVDSLEKSFEFSRVAENLEKVINILKEEQEFVKNKSLINWEIEKLEKLLQKIKNVSFIQRDYNHYFDYGLFEKDEI